MLNDLRYAVRMLAKSPGFTAAAMLTLALGIGANTTVFSVVRGVLLRPLPFTDPDQLVQIDMVHAESGLIAKGTSFLNFEDWRSQNDVFREMAAVQDTTLTLTGDGEPEQIHAWGVSARFFPLLGVQPVQGRVFEDDDEMRDPVVVVSHRLWQTRLGAQAAILDRHMTLDGRSYAVIGIMPASFNLPGDATDVWIPLGSAFTEGPRGNQHLFTLAILKRGVSLSQAQSAMDVIAQRLARQFPDDNAGWGVRLNPLHRAIAGKLRPALLILLGCVGLVFLIVCLNIANLVLARGAARNREIAIRVALGASRSQVVRQFMIESLLVSLCGGALGLLLAAWGLRLLRAIPSSSAEPTLTGLQAVPPDAARVDGTVLLFLLLASIAASVLLGLIPALRSSRPHFNQALRGGGQGADRSGRGRDRVRDSVVVVQVAAALVLLVGAALLTGSFARLMRVNPGFRPASVLCAEIALARSSYPEMPQVAAFWDRLRERVAAIPGVDSVGAVNLPPFGTNNMARFSIQGRVPRAPGQLDSASYRVTTPGYFRALGIPLLQGRSIAEEDRADAPSVMVIDDAMAKRFWPGESPVGAVVHIGGPPRTVVGVVGAVKQSGLDADLSPTFYLPQKQEPMVSRQMTLMVRTRGNPLGLAAAVRTAVKAIDANQPVARIQSMESVVSTSVGNRRLTTWGLGGFAILGLVLVAIGLYGVVSLSVARRTKEIGVRVALGAPKQQLLLLVVRQGMRLALAGVGIGVVAALALSRVMSSVVFEVTPTDPLTFASVSCLLLLVALLACWLPARRAAGIDPVVALRCE